MANAVVQWGVDQLYSGLQELKSKIDAVAADLNADKAQLAQMYDTARQNMDPARDVYLAPLIHQNTVLRLTYLKPIQDKFNSTVAAASKLIRGAGYTPPTLSGMGVVPLVPAVLVTAVVVALAAVATAALLTSAQRARTAQMAGIFSNPSYTVDQKLALAKSIQQQTDAERKANPPLFDPSSFVIPLVIVAAIVLGPQLLGMFRSRKAAAA